MPVVAALGGALCIGSADFLGGLSARKSHPLVSAASMNVVALILLGLVCAFVDPHLAVIRDLGGVGAGVLSAVGVCLIYATFAASAMSITAPLIACGSALLPALATAAVGNLPTLLQLVGMVFAVVGMIAITWVPAVRHGHSRVSRRSLLLATGASVCGGCSFALLVLAVKGGDVRTAVGVAGVARVASTCVAVGLAAWIVRSTGPARPPLAISVAAGLFDGGGSVLLVTAATLGSGAVAAVIVSLYAVVTVLLAQTVLRERLAGRQSLGMLAAALGVVLLAVR